MNVVRYDIEGVFELTPKKIEDARGYFSETFRKSAFSEFAPEVEFVQENKSMSRKVGTVRGLHFQIEPFPQAKLVSVARGSVLDVAVDIRRNSPTFGRHVAVTLTAEAGNQLFIPAGFAHGFCTLEPDVEIVYKVTNYYAPAQDRSVLWSDPALGIAWPVGVDAAEVSEKDARAPRLSDAPDLF